MGTKSNIYFTTYGDAGNSSHDRLHLLDIRSTTEAGV